MSDDSDPKYELVFEGPKDQNQETLRRLKGSFVADLDFSVEEVQKFLSEAPLVIRRSDTRAELEVMCSALDKAGAKVLLVQRGAQVSAQPETDDEYSVEFELSPKLQEPKVYSLDYNPDEEASLESLVKAVEAETPEPKDTSGTVPVKSAPLKDLQFELNAEQATPAVKTSSNSSVKPPAAADVTPAFQFDSENVESSKIFRTNDAPAPAPNETHGGLELDLKIAPEEPLTAAPTVSKVSAAQLDDFDLTLAPESSAPRDEKKPPHGMQQSASPIDLDLSIKEEVPTPAPPPTAHTKPPPKEHKPDPTPSRPALQRKRMIDAPKLSELKTPQIEVQRSAAAPSVGAEEAEEEHKAASTAKRAARRRSGWEEYVLPILLGAAILTAINYFYFSAPNDDIDADLLARLAQKAADAGAGKARSKHKNSGSFVPLEGELSGKDASLGYYLEMVEGKVTHAAFSIIPPPPAPLSPTQVAAGEKTPPWIRKISVEVPSITFNDAHEYSQELEAKFYIETGGKSVRKMGNAFLKVKLDTNDGAIYVVLRAATNDLKLDQIESSAMLRSVNDTFSASAYGEWSGKVASLSESPKK